MKRKEKDLVYLTISILIGHLSASNQCRRARVSCIIVKGDRVISSGYNIPYKPCQGNCDINKPCTNTTHAESSAIYKANESGVSLKNSTLFCTHSPCSNCAKKIIASGIKRVVYYELYRVEKGIQMLQAAGIICEKILCPEDSSKKCYDPLPFSPTSSDDDLPF